MSSPGRLRLWLERGEAGYWLRDAESGEAVRWSDERLRVVKVAGASYRQDALADDAARALDLPLVGPLLGECNQVAGRRANP